MAFENCEIEVYPETAMTVRVSTVMGDNEDDRWDAMLAYCLAQETPGEFSYDVMDKLEEKDVLVFFFTDANAAFEFKMKFC